MSRRFVVIVVLLAALGAACSADDKAAEPVVSSATAGAQQSPAAATAPAVATRPAVSPTAAAAAAGKWDSKTVFEYGFGAPGSAWQQGCGKIPISVDPKDPCIIQVMQLEKASATAIEFFQKQQYFLVVFEEKGRVDYGQGGAPWFNMGRPTPHVFLNGSPDIIEASIPQDYKTLASYANVLKPATARPGNVFTPLPPTPWLEYGELTTSTSSASGQRLVISYPLRECRACPDLGELPIAYNFDAQGRLTGTETLPFKAP